MWVRGQGLDAGGAGRGLEATVLTQAGGKCPTAHCKGIEGRGTAAAVRLGSHDRGGGTAGSLQFLGVTFLITGVEAQQGLFTMVVLVVVRVPSRIMALHNQGE